MVCNPARREARHRRSPAISSKRSVPTALTRIGCRTPRARMESVSEARLSSSKWARGWLGFGSTAETGTCRSTESESAFTSGGMRAPRPLPNPLRRATAHLLGQLAIGDGPARRRVEHDDGLSEGGRLRQTHSPGDDVAADLVAEVVAHLVGHLLGQVGAG